MELSGLVKCMINWQAARAALVEAGFANRTGFADGMIRYYARQIAQRVGGGDNDYQQYLDDKAWQDSRPWYASGTD